MCRILIPVAGSISIKDIFSVPNTTKVYGLTDTGYFFVYDWPTGAVTSANWSS
jgi:hypothetical protein